MITDHHLHKNLYFNLLPDDKLLDWKIEINYRRYFKAYLKWKVSAIWGRKHYEKRRKLSLQEKEKLLVTNNISFSHNVSHSYISLVHQNVVLCGNGLTGMVKLKKYFNTRFVYFGSYWDFKWHSELYLIYLYKFIPALACFKSLKLALTLTG